MSVETKSILSNISEVDELDESFDDKPVTLDLPTPLTNSELNKMHEMMKSKSNKEIMDIINQIATNGDKSELNKKDESSSILKNLKSSSKRELINMMSLLVNQKNKHLIFQNASKLDTVKNDELRNELRKKLHNKIYMSNKNNLKKMYEKMAEGLQTLEEPSESHEPSDQNEQNITENIQSVKSSKSKKKNKKLNRQKLQEQFMNQMANLIKEQSQPVQQSQTEQPELEQPELEQPEQPELEQLELEQQKIDCTDCIDCTYNNKCDNSSKDCETNSS